MDEACEVFRGEPDGRRDDEYRPVGPPIARAATRHIATEYAAKLARRHRGVAFVVAYLGHDEWLRYDAFLWGRFSPEQARRADEAPSEAAIDRAALAARERQEAAGRYQEADAALGAAQQKLELAGARGEAAATWGVRIQLANGFLAADRGVAAAADVGLEILHPYVPDSEAAPAAD